MSKFSHSIAVKIYRAFFEKMWSDHAKIAHKKKPFKIIKFANTFLLLGLGLVTKSEGNHTLTLSGTEKFYNSLV